MELHPERVSHSEPHPVYVVTLDDLVAGKLLDAAKQTGWRYLLVQNDVAVGEAEVGARRAAARGTKGGAKTAKLEFLGLTHGPFTDATIDALNAAERMPKVAKADYEMRLLKVPAVYLAALWLHGEDTDIVIPMGDPPGGLKKNRAYTEAGVIRALRGVALQTRQFQHAYDETRRKRRK
ncbi:MAG: hypothetical protein ABI724_18065 [Betaproteobacteria bacterium]